MIDQAYSKMAEEVARAASAFELQATGHAPESVTVVLSDQTLVITLHGALSTAEQVLVQSPAGAAQVQEFHQQLFAIASGPFQREIKRITGVAVREASAEVATTTSAVVKLSAPGTKVHVFLLAGSVPVGTWSGNGQGQTVVNREIQPC
ncbi:MAG TPA: Na-translocating system protein MpsC family protein [Phycisphaerae bacterium]|nr:Na-translocating system protein MpsC family protein [Phycisphaerae bacterium]